MNIPDRQVIFFVVTHDPGSFQLVTSPSSRSSLCFSIQPTEREGLYVEDIYGPGPKVMDISSAYIPLPRTQEHDDFQLQRRQGELVSPGEKQNDLERS